MIWVYAAAVPAAAHAILAVIGLDMARFPTAGHLVSWARYAPGVKESAGKKKGKNSTGHGNTYLARVLGYAAAAGAAPARGHQSPHRGRHPPVAFFAYLDRPGLRTPDGAADLVLAGPDEDIATSIADLADQARAPDQAAGGPGVTAAATRRADWSHYALGRRWSEPCCPIQ
jgi:hypothetical protein